MCGQAAAIRSGEKWENPWYFFKIELAMYSDKLEELISAALQDGNLTEQKRNIIMRRAEKEGEDVEEVMMVVESRLQQVANAPIKAAKANKAAASKSTNEDVSGNSFVETVNGVSFKMIRVEGGTFTMFEQGEESPNRDRELEELLRPLRIKIKPQKVTLDDYYMCETLITQELWIAVMGKKSCTFNFKGNLFPVNNVSWNDCKLFLEKLNKLTGKQYHLPSEAQWVYAAIGGKHSIGYKYAGSNDYLKVAWCSINTQTYNENDMLNLYNSHHFFKAKKLNDSVRSYFFLNYKNERWEIKPVAQLRPNELGLYDMSGNVCEFCEDDFDDEPMLTMRNPIFRGQNSVFKVLRSFSVYEPITELGKRSIARPDERSEYNGFRITL